MQEWTGKPYTIQTIDSPARYDIIMQIKTKGKRVLDIKKIKLDIMEKLKPLNPQRVILFGSYVSGTPTKDSDIDLYVLSNDEFMPQTWKQKSA